MRIILILIFSLSVGCFASELEQAIHAYGLTEVEIPEGKRLDDANSKDHEFCVYKVKKKIVIKKVKDQCEAKLQSVVINGHSFIGTNNGEFGGNLLVKFPDGSEKILIDDNIVQIIPFKGSLFVFTGLSHMFVQRGAVYRVNISNEKITSERLTLLPGAPEVILMPDEKQLSFMIITSSGLLYLDLKNDSLRALLIDQFWGTLYPNSAVMDGKQLAIGMRSGLALIDYTFINSVDKVRYFTSKD